MCHWLDRQKGACRTIQLISGVVDGQGDRELVTGPVAGQDCSEQGEGLVDMLLDRMVVLRHVSVAVSSSPCGRG